MAVIGEFDGQAVNEKAAIFEKWVLNNANWWGTVSTVLDGMSYNHTRLFGDTRLGEEAGDIITINIRYLTSLLEGAAIDKTVGGNPVSSVERLGGADDLVGRNNGQDALNSNGLDFFFSTGGGKDVIQGSTNGDDVIAGNRGHDIIDGHGGDDFVKGGAGRDTIEGGNGNDLLYGDYSDSERHDKRQGKRAWDDEIFGEQGNDVLFGNQGDDLLDGGQGMDTLFGGLGDDTLVGGGNEADLLQGDAGHDVFLFEGSEIGFDTVVDFTRDGTEMDIIRTDRADSLDDLVFTDVSEGVAIQFGDASDVVTFLGTELSDFTAEAFDFI